MHKKVIIVGSGLTGSTIARQIVENIESVRILLIDKRNHIGGNILDEYDESGILIHRYGPHIFHTNEQLVFNFLKQFSEWKPYYHRVLTSVDGQLIPIPINLLTLQKILGRNLTTKEAQEYLESVKVNIETPHSASEQVKKQVGEQLYEKFFKGYTEKMWGLNPDKLEPSITGRIPVRTNFDDRYFTDRYQFMPKYGYTQLVQNMLGHPRIHVLLQTEWKTVREYFKDEIIVFTGPIDEYFDYQFGRLAYRSIRFEFETYPQEFVQQASVINYPNEYEFTRVTEYKHLTGQIHTQSTICREYPKNQGEPYYPVLTEENKKLKEKYLNLSKNIEGRVWFAGRLGTYSYLNMDVAVKQGLNVAEELIHRLGKEA